MSEETATDAPNEEKTNETPADEPIAEATVAEESAAPITSIDDLTPGTELTGKVKRLELYGAFVDIGIGQDALLHISQLSKANIRNVEDALNVGEDITVYILKVDANAKRVALSTQKPPEVSWENIRAGSKLTGTVIRIENFGVFVDVGTERPGMVHVSELAEGFVQNPSDVVSVGQEVKVRVLKVNSKKRQIDLSMKAPEEIYESEVADGEEEAMPTAMEMAFKRAMSEGGDGSDQQTQQRKQSKRSRDQQEDIIARTLRHHSQQ